ncbi:hypothetical protein T484DRAFT_1910494, partial [Baffinella frigidus]
MQPGDPASAEAGGEGDGWGDFGAFEDGGEMEGGEAPQQVSVGTLGGIDVGMIDDAFGDVDWGGAAGTASDPPVDDGDFFGSFPVVSPVSGDAPSAALPISGMPLEGGGEAAAVTGAALQDGATPPTDGDDDFGFGGFGEHSAGSAANDLLTSASGEAPRSAAALAGGEGTSGQGGALPDVGGIGEDAFDFGSFEEDPIRGAAPAMEEEDSGARGATGGVEGSEGTGAAANEEEDAEKGAGVSVTCPSSGEVDGDDGFGGFGGDAEERTADPATREGEIAGGGMAEAPVGGAGDEGAGERAGGMLGDDSDQEGGRGGGEGDESAAGGILGDVSSREIADGSVWEGAFCREAIGAQPEDPGDREGAVETIGAQPAGEAQPAAQPSQPAAEAEDPKRVRDAGAAPGISLESVECGAGAAEGGASAEGLAGEEGMEGEGGASPAPLEAWVEGVEGEEAFPGKGEEMPETPDASGGGKMDAVGDGDAQTETEMERDGERE